MDLAYYLNEILGLQGEVNVPGLGYFVKVRVNGHYNDNEGKFYPPYSEVQFDPQTIEDEDILLKYIANKKKISLASAKYFTEKYISELVSQAALKDTELGELGWLYTEGFKLRFKSKPSTLGDPLFFGLPEIQVYKLGQQPVPNRHIPDLSLTIAPEAVPHEPVEAEAEYTDSEEEYEEKRGIPTWAIVLLVAVVLIGAAIAGLYWYKPAVFALKNNTVKQVASPRPKTVKPVVIDSAKDTLTTAQVRKDSVIVVGNNKLTVGKLSDVSTKPVVTPATTTSAEKTTATKIPAAAKIPAAKSVEKAPAVKPAIAKKTEPARTIPLEAVKNVSTISNDDTRIHYEILAGAYKTTAKANEAIAKYQRKGLDARILTNVPGKLRKITLGTYYKRTEAIEAQKDLLTTGKIKPRETLIQPYNPKK
ncbi:MAG: hypothetical protein EOP47_20600 [Sphingobacteriaceae bacterium]|nr:MAG: hypothetical protein EOP47_20600 [Sphingobacteriaceae bacterium]